MEKQEKYQCEVANCCQSTNGYTVTLQNKELWEQFHNLQTEMIITKSGRRMFPTLRVSLSDLDPRAHYCIFLEMTPASNCRYRYSASGGWAPAGAEEVHSPHRMYLHPESPATGEHWMSQPVSFGRLKLTNTAAPPPGHVVLSSMHKYQPRIVIVKSANPRGVLWAPSVSVAFPETQFIAVTAYQNERITKLKIDNNPFAKGFRVNGQSSKAKRKRVIEEPDETSRCKKHETSTPGLDSSSSGDDSSESPPPSSPVFNFGASSNKNYLGYSRYPSSFVGMYPQFYYYPSSWYPMTGAYYRSSFESNASRQLLFERNDASPPRKVTDFSIRALLGTTAT